MLELNLGDGRSTHTSEAWAATTDCQAGLSSSIATSRLPDAPRPRHKMLEELADEILRRFIRQVSFRIKAGGSDSAVLPAFYGFEQDAGTSHFARRVCPAME